jgi:enhancing lycopene biosynthesis protein 2
VKASELDALVFPSGYGAAKNPSDYTFKGSECSVYPDVARLAREMHAAPKPIGVICIAPVIAAKVFGSGHLGRSLLIS